MIARVFQECERFWRNLQFAPIKGELPEKAFLDNRIDPDVSSKQISRNPWLGIGRADERRIDVAHDRRDKVIGYEIDRVGRLDDGKSVIDGARREKLARHANKIDR